MRRILADVGVVRRQIAKVLPGAVTADRDPQFGSMAQLKAQFLAAGELVLRIDTKKKECLGILYRHDKV